jgi:hypothetical protein
MIKRAAYLLVFLMVSISAGAQINLFMGGNLQANYSSLSGDESAFKPGFGGGFSFVYWEHEYWFMKAGLDYMYRSSSVLDYPYDYGVDVTDPDDKVHITFTEQTVGIPLIFYFRPFEKGADAMLVTGSMQVGIVTGLKENTEEFGELVLKGNQVKSRVKTNLGIGVGYQRQLDKNLFLNIFPSFNLDLRTVRAFHSVTLTAEIIFGVY